MEQWYQCHRIVLSEETLLTGLIWRNLVYTLAYIPCTSKVTYLLLRCDIVASSDFRELFCQAPISLSQADPISNHSFARLENTLEGVEEILGTSPPAYSLSGRSPPSLAVAGVASPCTPGGSGAFLAEL